LALARAGAHLVVVARGQVRVDAVLEELEQINPQRSHLGLALDVRGERDMEQMAQLTLHRFSRIDILVACAGIGKGTSSSRLIPYSVAQMPLEEWAEILDTNLKGVFLSNRAVLPAMIAQRRGDIVNIVSSRGGTAGQPYAAAYCASKFGVVGLSDTLAAEVGSHGIRVQLLFPDAMDTPLLKGSPLVSLCLSLESVADLIVYMVTLPDDCVLQRPIIAPVGVRHLKPTLSRVLR
jgi:NAD(P)-dependent dehydrogenase (short-subunit alcohol dehydrogenase family)